MEITVNNGFITFLFCALLVIIIILFFMWFLSALTDWFIKLESYIYIKKQANKNQK